MANLETQVREALIEYTGEKLFKYASEESKFKSMAAELAETLIDSFLSVAVAGSEPFDEKETAKMKEEYKRKILPQIQAQLGNPEQLRQLMFEQARNQYRPLREVKKIVENHVADLKKENVIEGYVLGEYKQSYECLYEFTKAKDKFVARLVKIAKTKGIKKAVDKRTRYAILREMFPTREECMAFEQKAIEVQKSFYQQARKALARDGEFGQMGAEFFGIMEKVTEKARDTTLMITKKYLEREMKEIYGQD